MLLSVPTYKDIIEVWQVDMADFDSVKVFGRRVAIELDRVDIFVANAGIQASTWRTTKDGYEET